MRALVCLAGWQSGGTALGGTRGKRSQARLTPPGACARLPQERLAEAERQISEAAAAGEVEGADAAAGAQQQQAAEAEEQRRQLEELQDQAVVMQEAMETAALRVRRARAPRGPLAEAEWSAHG